MALPFNLSRFLPYRLANVSERMSRRLSVEYHKSHGLSVAEWRVLVHLLRAGSVSVRDIQMFTNLEKSRVSRAVSRLESAGLVAKHASAGDGRLLDIGLTKSGLAVINEIIPAATAIETRLMAGLSDAQKASFFEVIEHFHRILDDDPEARPRPEPRA